MPESPTNIVVDMHGVTLRFPGATAPVLSAVDLRIKRGETWGLIGPGASGKSVLLKTLAGIYRPDTGSIVVEGEAITGASETALEKIRPLIGMLFQNYALFDFLDVLENVAFPLRRLGKLGESEILDRASDRLRSVGLGGSEKKFPNQLSGGMKKRVGLARALITEPPLLLYDEPTAGLDPVTTSKIYDLLLAERERTKATILAVSSDIEALMKFAPHIAMLLGGELVYAGATATVGEHADPRVRQFVSGDTDGPL